jgi:hypothetical protein
LFSKQTQKGIFTQDVWNEIFKQQNEEQKRNRVVDEEYDEKARVVWGRGKGEEMMMGSMRR